MLMQQTSHPSPQQERKQRKKAYAYGCIHDFPAPFGPATSWHTQLMRFSLPLIEIPQKASGG